MEVLFRTRKLQKQYLDYREGEKSFGKKVARKYILRVNIIKISKDIEELRRQSVLHCHPLKGKRAGQWAVNLTESYRLIFSLHGKSLEVVRIEEVSKHYGD
jgi:proteic killer suppression protein